MHSLVKWFAGKSGGVGARVQFAKVAVADEIAGRIKGHQEVGVGDDVRNEIRIANQENDERRSQLNDCGDGA